MKKSQSTKANNRAKSKPSSSSDPYQDVPDSISNSIMPPPSSQDKSENVRVSIRIRPMNEQEQERGDANCLGVDGEKVIQINYK